MRQSVKSAILVHVLKNEHKINGGNTVKFIRQFLIIILISFAGELLHAILPLPVPASIYGFMPMLFIPAGVGLMVSWGDLKPVLVPIMVTIVVTTVLVMGVSGRTAQFVLKKEEKKDE